MVYEVFECSLIDSKNFSSPDAIATVKTSPNYSEKATVEVKSHVCVD